MTKPTLPIRVIKLGGSLWRYENLPSAFWGWLEEQPAATNIILPGGGELTDCIRRADVAFKLSEKEAHWMCVELLGAAAMLCQQILSTHPSMRCPLVLGCYDYLSQLSQEGTSTITVIFDPRDFLKADEPYLPGDPLKQSWNVTSDSIAARLAEVLCASELVLLKSALPPANEQSLEAASTAGYVDTDFARTAGRLETVRCVNLRDPKFQEVRLA